MTFDDSGPSPLEWPGGEASLHESLDWSGSNDIQPWKVGKGVDKAACPPTPESRTGDVFYSFFVVTFNSKLELLEAEIYFALVYFAHVQTLYLLFFISTKRSASQSASHPATSSTSRPSVSCVNSLPTPLNVFALEIYYFDIATATFGDVMGCQVQGPESRHRCITAASASSSSEPGSGQGSHALAAHHNFFVSRPLVATAEFHSDTWIPGTF